VTYDPERQTMTSSTITRLRAELDALEADTPTTATDHVQYADRLQRIQNEAAALKLQSERTAAVLARRGDDIDPAAASPARQKRLAKLANVPTNLFDDYLTNAYSRGDEITRSAVLRLAPVKPRTTISAIEFAAPSITEEIALNVAGEVGEELAELIAASLEVGINELVEHDRIRQAFIWSKYHGISTNGEQDQRWSFAGISQMVPNANGNPVTREYVESQYYRAHAWMMARLASDALHHLRIAVSGEY
jgi:hypothetical protein